MGMCFVNNYSTFELLGFNAITETVSSVNPCTTKHQNGM